MRDPSSISVHELIELGYENRASDLMIKGGSKPMFKQFAKVVPIPGEWPVITAEHSKRMISALMNEEQRRVFEETHEMDIAFAVGDKCRVRANIHRQRGTYAIVCRIIPLEIKSIEDLGLPPVLKTVCDERVGLVLVTGPTGSGKTTTLAAMLDLINKRRPVHIVTVEDPLEFVHPDQAGYVTQREVHIDTLDFQPAMRAMLREAPDVILIGEMRDPTTMNIAMQAGETGHLVFSTVHTASAYETMDRVVNMFPPHERNYLCQRLAGALRGIIAQKLIPRADGQGRVVANEILICTPTVSKAIEDGHFSDLYNLMKDGEYWGMQTMNQSLVKLVKAGLISEETAMAYAGITSELKQMLRQ